MKDYLKQTYLLSVLFIYIGAVHAQKNSYDNDGSVFNVSPRYTLSLFGSVQSIQIEDSFFIKNAGTNMVEVNYTARRYFYDVNRKKTRVLQLYAPLDTSYDIEYLNYETQFIKKGTWYRPSEQEWTEIDTLNKTVKSFHAKEGKVVRQSITRYVGNFRPVERLDYENGKEVMAQRNVYTPDDKLSLNIYKGLFTSFARSIKYKQGKPIKEELYNNVSSLDSFEKDQMHYRAEAVYGPDGAVVHCTYFKKGKKVREENFTYNMEGLLIAGRERNGYQVYTYDKTGNVLSTIRKDSNGHLIQQIFNVYNERQDLVKVTMYWYGDHTVETFTYLYDEKGNWTKQFQYDYNKLKAIITRKIEYY